MPTAKSRRKIKKKEASIMKSWTSIFTVLLVAMVTLAFTARTVLAQEKAKAEKAKPAPAEQKAEKTKGQSATKVLFENEKYRVVETRSQPGQKNEMKARSDRVIYSFNAGKSRVYYPDGKTEDVEFKAGEVRFRKADKSQSENIGKTENRNLVITAK
jgi:uncharacterized protein (DUF2147 family)